MICIQKIYCFHGLNHQIIEESWDVTPVTYIRTDGRKVENRAVFCWTRNRNVPSALRRINLRVAQAALGVSRSNLTLPETGITRIIGKVKQSIACLNRKQQMGKNYVGHSDYGHTKDITYQSGYKKAFYSHKNWKFRNSCLILCVVIKENIGKVSELEGNGHFGRVSL